MRQVCVVGAGAIGSLCAGHLATVSETSVLTRRPQHAEALNDQGLRISGKSDLHVRVRASVDPADLGDPDLVIIATKATHVEDAARTIEGHFPNATVMTIQNGLGCEDAVARRGDWPIVSAVTFMSGIRLSDVHSEYELDAETWMGPWAGTGLDFDDVKKVADLFVAAGLKARAFADLRPAQWSKLIFNSVMNSVGALTELPHTIDFAQREHPWDLGHLVFRMMEEGRNVASALGIELHQDPWDMNVQAIKRGQSRGQDYAHFASMLKDVWRRQPTEIDWITGALVREANKAGVPVPLNEVMHCLVKAREASWQYEHLKPDYAG